MFRKEIMKYKKSCCINFHLTIILLIFNKYCIFNMLLLHFVKIKCCTTMCFCYKFNNYFEYFAYTQNHPMSNTEKLSTSGLL